MACNISYANDVFIPKESKDIVWDVEYTGDAWPDAQYWTTAGKSDAATLNPDRTLTINTTLDNSSLYFTHNWTVDPVKGWTAEIRMRVHEVTGQGHMITLELRDGVYNSRIGAFNTTHMKYELDKGGNGYYAMDVSEWHTYRIVRKGTNFSVYLDDNPVPIVSSSTHTAPAGGLNFIRFGDGTSNNWIHFDIDFVRYSSEGAFSIPAPLDDDIKDSFGNSILAYPNIFTDQVSLAYILKGNGNISLKIYSEDGEEVVSFPTISADEGHHFQEWDGKDFTGTEVPAGIYICQGIITYDDLGTEILKGVVIKGE